jgi:hypothetical protein
LVDALTRMTRDLRFACDRTEADPRATSLLGLVSDSSDRVVPLAAYCEKPPPLRAGGLFDRQLHDD